MTCAFHLRLSCSERRVSWVRFKSRDLTVIFYSLHMFPLHLSRDVPRPDGICNPSSVWQVCPWGFFFPVAGIPHASHAQTTLTGISYHEGRVVPTDVWAHPVSEGEGENPWGENSFPPLEIRVSLFQTRLTSHDCRWRLAKEKLVNWDFLLNPESDTF